MEFVIARYTENLAWLDKVLDPEQRKMVTIYNKGPEDIPGSIRLPNVGREAHTYLTHIINNYDTLAEKVVFLQGYPFDHLGYNETNFQMFLVFNHMTQNVTHYPMLYNGREPRPSIQKTDVCLGEWFEKVLQIEFPKDDFVYYGGACFGVTREKIRARPKEFYERVIKTLDTIDPETAYYLERAWYYIFL